MPDIDFGQISEALNNKTDRDLRNVDTTAKADAVIDYQEPTAENGYTWYRKYKSGWVEQGGTKTAIENNADYVVTFPIEMANLKYTYTLGQSLVTADIYNSRHAMADYSTKTKTGIHIKNARFSGTTTVGMEICWQVSGMAA